ncbi:unnamed protein product [Bursaphelenchus okinawaensis]|uniref:Uncharacterized protein n=1 Tax=Bursaphelenchus okinawaensis TaxID=465554 RepID=A0A811KH24_9BILA|nr:unnamed protein product [Bursaphelenchus okinawaensis]CAG9104362.1 unnamed protein product [Bursaphelenchus okinawaensis]
MLQKSKSLAYVKVDNAPLTPLNDDKDVRPPIERRYYSKTSPDYPSNYFLGQMSVDDHWFDTYRKFSPLQYRSMFPRRYYAYGDYVPSYPFYWSYPDTYFNRYKKYFGKSVTPFPNYSQRYGDSYYRPEIRSSYYSPYRSWVMSL